MRFLLLAVVACCGCLGEALPDVDMNQTNSGLDMPTSGGSTLCKRGDDGRKKVLVDAIEVEVECLADFEGGWLLVGRSGEPRMPANAESFGWTVSTGSLDELDEAYSLGADLRFQEVLVVAGLIGDDSNEVGHVLIKPADFNNEFGQRTIDAAFSWVSSSHCVDETETPTMFNRMGYAFDDSKFWFGDQGDLSRATGLFSGGWKFGSNGCKTEGNFDGRRGAIYVRALHPGF